MQAKVVQQLHCINDQRHRTNKEQVAAARLNARNSNMHVVVLINVQFRLLHNRPSTLPQ